MLDGSGSSCDEGKAIEFPDLQSDPAAAKTSQHPHTVERMLEGTQGKGITGMRRGSMSAFMGEIKFIE